MLLSQVSLKHRMQIQPVVLDVKPGMRVVDTCAGADAYRIEAMSLDGVKVRLIAMDLYESKLTILKIKKRDTQLIESIRKHGYNLW
jgi:16S rRNA C967 or C1407 C5-methylase (RsmB/RsmF family)